MVFDCLGLNCIGEENKKKNVVYEQRTYNVCLFVRFECLFISYSYPFTASFSMALFIWQSSECHGTSLPTTYCVVCSKLGLPLMGSAASEPRRSTANLCAVH